MPVKARRQLVLVVLVVTALSGCSTEGEDQSPVFNAIDPSLECPSGYVGWDFSTAGNDTDIINHDVSRAIKVTEASVGENCGAANGNFTQHFALQCDGQVECKRVVAPAGSPAVTCASPALSLKYRCGEETPVYNVILAGDARAKEVTLRCGQAITIVSATHGAEQSPKPLGNITAVVAQTCSGTRRCSLAPGRELNGSPAAVSSRVTEVHYICGGEAVEYTKTFAEGERIDFMCDSAEKTAVFNDTIRIGTVKVFNPELLPQPSASAHPLTTAAYNAVNAFLTTFEASARAVCDGKRDCAVPINLSRDDVIWGTQAGKWRTDRDGFQITYWCGAEENQTSRNFVLRKLKNEPLELKCGEAVHPIAARFDYRGYDAAQKAKRVVSVDPATKLLSSLKTACDGKRVCELPSGGRYSELLTTYIDKGPLPLTSDGVNSPYQSFDHMTVDYTCGSNTLYTYQANFEPAKDYELGRPAYNDFECPTFDADLFRGIRIKTATRTTTNDIIVQVTNRCFGRDTCILPSTEFGAATVLYRCGRSDVLKTAEPASTGLRLTCEPPVHMVTLNGCLSGQKPVEPCTTPGAPGTCVYNVDAVAKNCQDASIDYRCGEDSTVRTAVGQKAASGRIESMTIKCPTLPDPVVKKACVPATCKGGTRRNEKLECVPDGTKFAVRTIDTTSVQNLLRLADGGVSPAGGQATTTLLEDQAYQVFSLHAYTSTGARRLPDSTTAVVWAYDEYSAKPDAGTAASAQTVVGFRCVIEQSDIRGPEPIPVSGQTRFLKAGGKGGVIPANCFRQDATDDVNSSWTDAARRLNMTESRFRTLYDQTGSRIIASLDPTGAFSYRAVGNTTQAINPIGFYFDPPRQWIDQLRFYAQTVSGSVPTAVTFQESRDIVLSAAGARVTSAFVELDVEKPALLPQFNVDFRWLKSGDSPLKNPLSATAKLANNTATTLARRNMRATIEIARKDPTLNDPWVLKNSMRFPSQPIEGGNALGQSDRLVAQLTPAQRTRLMTVRTANAPDGLMKATTEEDTLFLVRVCLDFDGLAREPGEAVVDNLRISATRDGKVYTAGIGKRCVDGNPFLLHRELFVRPTYPVATTRAAGDVGSARGQGDGSVNTANDIGTQATCARQCSVDADCSISTCVKPPGATLGTCGATDTLFCEEIDRTTLAVGGQANLALLSSSTKSQSEESPTEKEGQATSNMNLFSFFVFNTSKVNTAMQKPGLWRTEIPLNPSLSAVAFAINELQFGGVKAKAKQVKTKVVGKKKRPAFERDGMAMALSKDVSFWIGPLPMTLEVGFSVGFGFDATLILETDRQTIANKSDPIYPCLQSSGSCVVPSTTDLTFLGANDYCRTHGGALVELTNKSVLADTQAAVASVGAGNEEFWVGGQAAYLYFNPWCNDLATKTPACLSDSKTKYFWLQGNSAFAEQAGQNNTLLENSTRYSDRHAWGTTNPGALRTFVPDKAAVTYKKDVKALGSDRFETPRKFICEYPAVARYTYDSTGVSLGIEFSAGFGASLCTPSSRIGVCLNAELKLLSAGVSVEAAHSSMSMYDGVGAKTAAVGQDAIEGTWEAALLTGKISVEVRRFFYSDAWDIANYGGQRTVTGPIFQFTSSYRQAVKP